MRRSNGRPRKLVAQANRNGFYYVLDRTTGEFIAGTPYAKQTWAKGLDAKGRPLVKPGHGAEHRGRDGVSEPSGRGQLVQPELQPADQALLSGRARVGARSTIRARRSTSPVRLHGRRRPPAEWRRCLGAIRALEATTGKLKWEFKLLSPGFSSLLSTAGGLVFGGTEEGNFFALDAETGKPLWDMQLGANIRGIPVSFAIDGKQYVAIGAGFALFVYGLP